MAERTKHFCRWPTCTHEVPLRLWGCRYHWYQLPQSIRDEIWRTYRAGQENDLGKITTGYRAAEAAAQLWIRETHPELVQRPIGPPRERQGSLF